MKFLLHSGTVQYGWEPKSINWEPLQFVPKQ